VASFEKELGGGGDEVVDMLQPVESIVVTSHSVRRLGIDKDENPNRSNFCAKVMSEPLRGAKWSVESLRLLKITSLLK
jgi:hypothetical protein